MVVIIDSNKIPQLQMTSSRSRLGSDTLHSTSIAKVHIRVIVNNVISGLIKDGSGVGLSDGKADGVRETLPERTSGNLNTRGISCLGVTRCLGSELL